MCDMEMDYLEHYPVYNENSCWTYDKSDIFLLVRLLLYIFCLANEMRIITDEMTFPFGKQKPN